MEAAQETEYTLSFEDFKEILEREQRTAFEADFYPRQRSIYHFFSGYAQGTKNAKVDESKGEVHFFFHLNHAIITETKTII